MDARKRAGRGSASRPPRRRRRRVSLVPAIQLCGITKRFGTGSCPLSQTGALSLYPGEYIRGWGEKLGPAKKSGVKVWVASIAGGRQSIKGTGAAKHDYRCGIMLGGKGSRAFTATAVVRIFQSPKPSLCRAKPERGSVGSSVDRD